MESSIILMVNSDLPISGWVCTCGYINYEDSNIENYSSSDKTIPIKVTDALNDQCNRLQISGLTFDVFTDITADGINALVIDVKGTDRLAYGSDSSHVIIGITYDKLNRLYVKHTYI